MSVLCILIQGFERCLRKSFRDTSKLPSWITSETESNEQLTTSLHENSPKDIESVSDVLISK